MLIYLKLLNTIKGVFLIMLTKDGCIIIKIIKILNMFGRIGKIKEYDFYIIIINYLIKLFVFKILKVRAKISKQ